MVQNPNGTWEPAQCQRAPWPGPLPEGVCDSCHSAVRVSLLLRHRWPHVTRPVSAPPERPPPTRAGSSRSRLRPPGAQRSRPSAAPGCFRFGLRRQPSIAHPACRSPRARGRPPERALPWICWVRACVFTVRRRLLHGPPRARGPPARWTPPRAAPGIGAQGALAGPGRLAGALLCTHIGAAHRRPASAKGPASLDLGWRSSADKVPCAAVFCDPCGEYEAPGLTLDLQSQAQESQWLLAAQGLVVWASPRVTLPIGSAAGPATRPPLPTRPPWGRAGVCVLGGVCRPRALDPPHGRDWPAGCVLVPAFSAPGAGGGREGCRSTRAGEGPRHRELGGSSEPPPPRAHLAAPPGASEPGLQRPAKLHRQYFRL